MVQERPDRHQDRHDVVDWSPLVAKEVEANPTIVVDVGVEHLAFEHHFWAFYGVLLGEGEG